MDIARETDPQNLLEEFFGQNEEAGALRRAGLKSKNRGEIPKVIHQIWLGSPLPAHLEQFRQTWQIRHPDWEFKLWTEDEIAGEKFATADLVESTACFGQKSDILRAEILYRYGGIYVDLDYECYRPLDTILKGNESFFATLRWIPQAHLGWPDLFPQPLIVCNSLFGAEAGTKLLHDYLMDVRGFWNDRHALDLHRGELDPISIYMVGGKSKAARMKETARRTYLPFHESAMAYVDQSTLIPPSYLNPVIEGWPGLYAMPNFWKQYRKSKSFPKFWKSSGMMPHTVARHWSKASWLG